MAPATLRAIVVGGGIAGMATALSLQEAGYTVTVLEKEENFKTRPGGIRCPPNMTRLLDRWLDKLMLVSVSSWPESLARLLDQRGDKPKLENGYHKCDFFILEKGDSGSPIGSIPIDDDLVEDMRGEFYYIPRADILDLFLALAKHEAVILLCSSEVVDLDAKSNEIEVHLTNGEKMTADLLVGADGHNSTIKNLGYFAESCQESGEMCLGTMNFTVPRQVIEADEELCTLIDHPTHWPIWMGQGYSMSANIKGLHGDLSVSIIYQVDRSTCPQIPLGRSTAVESVEDLHINGLGSIPTKLVLNAQDAFIEIVPLPQLAPRTRSTVSDDGRIVLVGQAAHSLVSGGLLSTALAVEEAIILGGVQKYARDAQDTIKLLIAYEETTNPHCTTVHQCEHDHISMLSRLDGYQEEQRDMTVSQNLAKEGEWMMIWRVWVDSIGAMGYDAHESVESWERDWGSILQSSIEPPLVVNITIRDHLFNTRRSYGYRQVIAHANSR